MLQASLATDVRMRPTLRALSVGCLIACCTMPAMAQRADVTFFVIGKHANFQQGASGNRAPVDFSFFSEVFLTSNGDASNAVLEFPTGERIDYRDMRTATGGDRDNLFLVSGEDRYTDFRSLQARYPDGHYRVSFATPSGDVSDGALQFAERPLPAAPKISIRQGAHHCRVLQAGSDATITWGPFAEGRKDANGVLDDLIFVILTDAGGNRVAHSGRPFEERPYLTYRDSEFTIDGDALQIGSYTLSVEHALLDDTTRFDGVPAFTTRAVTTKLDISVAAEPADCAPPAPTLDSQVTMFYYRDLEAAAEFYGEVLGLEKTFDWDWVKFFKTGPSSNVGLVKEGDGAYHQVQPNNAVMLSLVTPDVDAWYTRLAARDDVTFLKPLAEGGGIRSFLLQDPGGYTVEFFQWLDGDR